MTKEQRKHGPAGGWFPMPGELTLSPGLNPFQYRVLAILLERDNLFQSTKGETAFWCYLNWIVQHSGMSRSTVKKTLRRLEEMGFITQTSHKKQRQANYFHINWDAINAYQRPKTQDELDDLATQSILEERGLVSATTMAPSVDVLPVEDQEEVFVATRTEPEYDYETAPAEPEDWNMQQQLPTAEEWYQSRGKDILYKQDYPYMCSLFGNPANEDLFVDYVENMSNWIMPQVQETDWQSVFERVIVPGLNEYKKNRRKTQ